MQAALDFDLRKDGSKGRALTRDVGGLLQRGDRLDYITKAVDTCSDLRNLTPGTTRLHFYRPHPDNRLTFWNPLFFSEEFGETTNPENQVGDVLHTVDLGPVSFCGGCIFGLMFDNAAVVVCSCNPNTAVTRRQVLLMINTELTLWLLESKASGHEQVRWVTWHTLCGGHDNSIKAKGMQSRTLFFFGTHLLNKKLDIFRGSTAFDQAHGLLKCAQCLTHWFHILKQYNHKVPGEQCNALLRLCNKHIALWKVHSQKGCKPKHHAWFEMTRRIPREGNPLRHSTYTDESFNSLVAILARSSHPRTLPITVLAKYLLGRVLEDQPF